VTTSGPLIEERLPLNILRPARYQTRSHEMESQQLSIRELSLSIKSHGLLQPIIVRPVDNGFEIVAGHRRFYACKLLLWRAIPSYIKELSDIEAFEIQLVENIQRKTLNAVEEARAFEMYVTDHGWGGVTKLSNAIMKSEQYVSSRLQLLKLPKAVLERVISGQLKVSHALELVTMKGNGKELAAHSIVEENMSIREIRRLKQEFPVVKQALDEFKQSIDQDNPSTGSLFTVKEYNEESSGILHCKINHLKKVQLFLKISLARMDSLIHEYEDLLKLNEEEETDYNNNNNTTILTITEIQDTDPIAKLLMQFRIHIHSMLDDGIGLNSKLSKFNAIV
jgi:ParB family transcriptional regulator, chromosome partitioning protein